MQPTRRRSRRSTARALALAVALVAGCVTERADQPKGRDGTPPAAAGELGFGGPIANPVLSGTSVSRVTFALSELGVAPYDGVAVPLVSPDGSLAATQLPPAPPRRLSVAAPGADPARADGASVAIVALAPNGAATVRQEVFDARGAILLGRDAAADGFLIESPRPDGSRWIGLASWADGSVRWLVRGPAVAAHAVFGPAGSLLYSRRPVGGGRFELVRLDGGGRERTLSLPGADVVYPLLAPGGRYATALASSERGLRLVLIDLRAAGERRAGQIVRRFPLAGVGSLEGAAQVVAASQSASPGTPQANLGPIVYHPAMRRCVAVDVQRRTLLPLASGSVAAADAGAGRALCATPDGLVLWASRDGREGTSRVLADDYLPRRTGLVDRPFVLFTPVAGASTELRVFGLSTPGPPAGQNRESVGP